MSVNEALARPTPFSGPVAGYGWKFMHSGVSNRERLPCTYGSFGKTASSHRGFPIVTDGRELFPRKRVGWRWRVGGWWTLAHCSHCSSLIMIPVMRKAYLAKKIWTSLGSLPVWGLSACLWVSAHLSQRCLTQPVRWPGVHTWAVGGERQGASEAHQNYITQAAAQWNGSWWERCRLHCAVSPVLSSGPYH